MRLNLGTSLMVVAGLATCLLLLIHPVCCEDAQKNNDNTKSATYPTPNDPSSDKDNPVVPIIPTPKKNVSKPEIASVTPQPPSPSPASTGNSNCTNGTSTCTKESNSNLNTVYSYVDKNRGMLLRGFYVLIGLTGIIVVYFVVRTIRMNRRKNRTKRYGLLSTREDQLEMAPLDMDDDDDDMTVFDINNRQK